MSLEAEILNLLAADAPVAAIVGNRLRLEWLDQNTTQPAIALTRISGGREPGLNPANYFSRARVQIDCQAATYETTKTLAAAVVSVLHGYNGPAGAYQIDSITLDNETDLGVQAGDYQSRRVMLDFDILY